MALFDSLPGGDFIPIGEPPEWTKSLWKAASGKRLPLASKSPFLENFLVEAGKFWDSHDGDPPQSGIWTEQDSRAREFHLEASAHWVAGKRILVVRHLGSGFASRRQVYQTARDSLLAHERLIREIQKKEILLHCIVHDLSQPLTAMRGCFDLLLVETLPPNIAKFVNIGHRESLRQEQMIRGILEAFAADLSSQQSPGKDSAGPPDLASSAKNAVEQFSPAFEERGVHLVVDRRLDFSLDWHAIGDVPRIERILGNLLENALRYSPRGSTVTLGLEDRGSSILAFVDDEGPGLPKDASSDRIFALFSKGKDRPGKAGLGLYFCKMTVERWGGIIGADNRPGGGSRFWFRLLRAVRNSSASPESPDQTSSLPSAPAPPPSKPSRAPAKQLRILVADDNDTILELSVELLRARGHSVTPVSDGRAALAAFEKQKFDVVLLDQEMPRMNGLEAAQAIREREKQSGAPHSLLVNLSGNTSAEDTRRSLDAGFDALLPKPFERSALYQIVESSVAPASAPAPQAASPVESRPDSSLASPASVPDSHVSAVEDGDLASHLASITGGNDNLLRSLVSSFLDDAPKKLSAIRRAISRKDSDRLASAAHSFKGAIAIFNAQKSVAAARALESMGRARNLKGAAAEFRVLREEFDQLNRNLLAFLPKASVQGRRRGPSSRRLPPNR
ncbi:MAG TPA: response regulator [Verrucomicrobiae bacterium]|nr:response regulator [Verrucomicrobiae bacterium]